MNGVYISWWYPPVMVVILFYLLPNVIMIGFWDQNLWV